MTLALAVLAMVASVPLTGGRLARLADVRFRAAWVGAVALGLQLVLMAVVSGGDYSAHRVVHVVTYALGAYAVARNLSLPYAWLVALGGALNFIAILANGGVMPAAPAALERAGLETEPGAFTNSDAVEDPRLGFLGDVFAIPAGVPGANVFSVGDVLLLLGGFLVLHALTGSRLARWLHVLPARLGWRGRRRAGKAG